MLGYDRLTEALPLAEHSHEHGFEFVYVERGQASWEVHGETYTTSRGEIFHTRPDEWHRARMNHIEPCSIWWMILTAPDQNRPWLDLRAGEKQRLSQELHRLPRTLTVDPHIREAFRGMRLALEHPSRDLSALSVRHTILDILLKLLKPRTSSPLPPEHQEAMQDLAERIRRQPEKHWSVSQLAAELNVSEPHAYRLFHSMYGQSPASFVDRVRIKRACERLSTSRCTITEIAHELGFKTSQHFATVFKKYTGHSPSRWRQRYPQ